MRGKSIAKFVISFTAATVVVIGATLLFADKFLDQKKANLTCQEAPASHVINIKRDKMTPGHVDAKLCDSLTITNQGGKVRLIAFGRHESHITYDGVSEKILKKGESLRVTLNKLGSFTIHDHLQDEVESTFTVVR